MSLKHKVINWDKIEDELDDYVWDKATSQFWLDTRVPISNDLADWRDLSAVEQEIIKKVVGGLALLDTLQSEEGVNAMREDVRTHKEAAIMNNFLFMETIHAKSYGTILTSLNSIKSINEIYDWMNNDERMQYKVKRINDIYKTGNALQKKIASIFLEGVLYYSNFFAPLWYRGSNKLSNLAELIKLIIRDESVHGTYLGYKFRLTYNELPEEDQEELNSWMYELLEDLMENELAYTEEIYSPIGMVDDVKTFVRYNANKSLQNMGFLAYYENADLDDVNPIVMNGISIETANHDFFSQVGAGYLMGNAETMLDEDYDF
ncbi:ribonucleoside-diphosphate reductase beta chain [Carnobacterium iners]|uniref:ribonucleoside-diphosphate reductase n=1 Tax=Carnobacterium iners TaxID=1073423 RepID=A0A1X7MV62_9LACT|nr:class 1b ribonucleoside-diphosphate reductase subunit beta [Carnobacterium iners]SEK56130.1 ribonucleoside-diphosphate reductase beta chain [Carnobacterium iners]SMH28257.1 ribonucleoside-diphosphate reductase beta chain [Carnobacterium iners]